MVILRLSMSSVFSWGDDERELATSFYELQRGRDYRKAAMAARNPSRETSLDSHGAARMRLRCRSP